MRSSLYLGGPYVRCVAISLLSAALVAGCGRASEDSLESLKRDPQRLRLALEQCKQAPQATSERKCSVVAEAWRQRFFGNSPEKQSQDSHAREGSQR